MDTFLKMLEQAAKQMKAQTDFLKFVPNVRELERIQRMHNPSISSELIRSAQSMMALRASLEPLKVLNYSMPQIRINPNIFSAVIPPKEFVNHFDKFQSSYQQFTDLINSDPIGASFNKKQVDRYRIRLNKSVALDLRTARSEENWTIIDDAHQALSGTTEMVEQIQLDETSMYAKLNETLLQAFTTEKLKSYSRKFTYDFTINLLTTLLISSAFKSDNDKIIDSLARIEEKVDNQNIVFPLKKAIDDIKLFSEARNNSKQTGLIKNGQVVTILKHSHDWVYVTVYDIETRILQMGWCKDQYLR